MSKAIDAIRGHFNQKPIPKAKCLLDERDRINAMIDAIEDENTKLRELAVLQSVIFKHMSTCPTTDCQVCPVNDECAESVYLEGVLGIDDKETSWIVQWRSEDAADVRVENAKLRNEVDNLLDSEHLTSVAVAYAGCDECGEYKQTMLRLFAENAKLRDLVLGMMICSDNDEEAQKCPLYDENEPYRCGKDRLMGELGLSKE